MLWQSSKYAYIILGTTLLVKKQHLLAQVSDWVEKNQQLKLSPVPTITDKVVFVKLAELKGRIETCSLLPLGFSYIRTPLLDFVFILHSFLNYELFHFNDISLRNFVSEKKPPKNNASLRFPRFDWTDDFVSNNQKLLLIRTRFNCELWLWSQAPGRRFSQITCKSFASGTC